MNCRAYFQNSLAVQAIFTIALTNISFAQSKVSEQIDSTDYLEFYHYFYTGDFYCASGFYQKSMNDFPCNRQLLADGIWMYSEMIEFVSRESLKEGYTDSLMSLYDQLQSCFSEDSMSISNKKLYALYYIHSQNPEKYIWLFTLFQNAYYKSPEKFENYNILLYFDIARRCILSERHCLSDDEMEELYYQLDELLEKRIKADPNDIELVTMRDNLNSMIIIEPQINCKFVIDNLLPKLETKGNNEKLANNIVRLVFNCRDCSDAEFSAIIKALEYHQYNEHLEMLESIRRGRNKE